MSLLKGLRQKWKNQRRFKKFRQYVDTLPQGDHPEERIIGFRSPVNQQEIPLFVSSVDYRCMLINLHTQDYKIKEFFSIVHQGHYQQYIDIGANYGEFVAGSLNTVPHSLAIEANPIVARCLKRSFRDFSQIKVIDQAVSEFDDILQMRINPQYSGGNRLVEEGNETPEFFIDDSAFLLDVPCRKLSKLLEAELETQESVAIKIDVEGHEAVLLGEILAWFNPEHTQQLLIIFEFNQNSAHALHKLKNHVNRFIDLGFQLSTLASRAENFVKREEIEKASWEKAFEQSCEIILEYR